jgi:hypothetical protein
MLSVLQKVFVFLLAILEIQSFLQASTVLHNQNKHVAKPSDPYSEFMTSDETNTFQPCFH